MMAALFFKECRQTLRSLIYYIYVIVFVLFITSQMGSMTEIDELHKPSPEENHTGYGYSTDPQDIMENAIETLFMETYRNHYDTYPFGFIKTVILNEKELSEIKEMLEYCTGKSFQELCEDYVDYWENTADMADFDVYMERQLGWHIPIRADYTYEELEVMMEQVSKIVGKGSVYDGRYKTSAMKALDYEDILKEYEDLCEKDKITGAEMRMFCDYASIVLAFLPVFVGVAACQRDKRAKSKEVIASKHISGASLLTARYLANLFLLFLPVVICALLFQMPFYYEAGNLGIAADGLAFLKYTTVWLLPVIMVTLAVAFLVTELTDKILAIPVQVVWSLSSLFGATTLTGNFGWKLVVRWNEFGGYGRYALEKRQLYLNRGFYVILSLIFLGVAVFVYETKRKKGVVRYGKNNQDHK